MTVGGLANINIDCDKKEISIFCKHELPQTGSKIIGVVSVLFVQQPVSTTLKDSLGKICVAYEFIFHLVMKILFVLIFLQGLV